MTKAAVKRQAKEQTAQASLSRRFFAYLFDWYVGGLATALPIAFFSMRQYHTVQNQNIMLFSAPYGVIAGVLALMCAVLYYAVIPTWGWKGQTPGKRLLRLKIVQADGADASARIIFLRHTGESLWAGLTSRAQDPRFTYLTGMVISCMMSEWMRT